MVDDLLAEYGAGNLSEGSALLVATHLSLRPQSRRVVRMVEAVGGAMLRTSDGDAIDRPEYGLAATLERAASLPQEDCADEGGSRDRSQDVDFVIPRPLSTRLGMPLEHVPWRSLLPGLKEHKLQPFADGSKGTLLRVKGGGAIPHHAHEGRELTLVLWGAYSDVTGRYGRGDIAVADPTVRHKPIAEIGDDCICLVVQEAPARFTGVLGVLLHGFQRA